MFTTTWASYALLDTHKILFQKGSGAAMKQMYNIKWGSHMAHQML